MNLKQILIIILIAGLFATLIFYVIPQFDNRGLDDNINESIEPLLGFGNGSSAEIIFKYSPAYPKPGEPFMLEMNLDYCKEVPCDCHEWGCAMYCMECNDVNAEEDAP